jgi:two-component system chemotaxis sensor kinase CheA
MASKGRKSARDKAQQEFVAEAEELLERMRDDLSALAEAQAVGSEAPPATVNRLFRSAHTLKGSAGMFGQGQLAELAHHLEDVLDRLRMGRAHLDRAGLVLLDESVALAAVSLEKLGAGVADESGSEAMVDLVGRIAAWDARPAAPAAPTPPFTLPSSLLRAMTEYEEVRLRENLARGRGLHVVEVELALVSFEDELGEITRAIGEVGELISTLPSPSAGPDAGIRFLLLAASELGPAELAARLELDPAAVRAAHLPEAALPAARDASADSARRAGPGAAREGAAAAVPAPAAAEGTHGESAPVEADGASLRSLSATVRVDIKKLDELMNRVGELARERAALRALAERLAADRATAHVALELDKIQRGLERRVQALQADVLDVRMVPLRQVFDKLTRVARRLRLDLGKDVDVELRGAETELDKLIVEQLVDPLMHLVRNAFDHAIESAGERVAAGKPPAGRIRIEATQRGHDVVVSVEDDGRGIDLAAVRARAVERGLVASDVELSRKETTELLFLPGFSTRSTVSETSGRGVGLDVVRSNVAALGGMVGVESEPGRGTRVALTLPITLAILQALLVGVGEDRFAIPLGGVRETLLVSPEEVQRSAGRELLLLRGEALPVLRLAEEFGLGAVPRGRKQHAVVLGLGDARVALLVDRLEGQRDAVIKPVLGPLRSLRGVAGATELGGQTAVLVLDVSALIEDAQRRREARG